MHRFTGVSLCVSQSGYLCSHDFCNSVQQIGQVVILMALLDFKTANFGKTTAFISQKLLKRVIPTHAMPTHHRIYQVQLATARLLVNRLP